MLLSSRAPSMLSTVAPTSAAAAGFPATLTRPLPEFDPRLMDAELLPALPEPDCPVILFEIGTTPVLDAPAVPDRNGILWLEDAPTPVLDAPAVPDRDGIL